MNDFQTMYKNLLALSNDEATPFYHSDQDKHGDKYRLFAYHYTERDSWLLPDALESRGITFEIDDDENAMRIAARPMPKFFNKGEVDFIDYGPAEMVMAKADGSLMSTYLDSKGDPHIKSKGSLNSDHCIAAEAFMYDAANEDLLRFIIGCEMTGHTVNMEWVSPDPKFRIVLYYGEPRLIILNVRNRTTGDYLSQESITFRYKDLDVVETFSTSVLADLEDQTGIEGYVAVDANNNWWKEKCPWYLERHRAKDFVNQPLSFIELVLKEEADDVYALIADQPEILKEMQDLQHRVTEILNTVINKVTAYYNTNKDLSRKDYAIKGKTDLGGFEFPVAMMYYSGEEPDWKAFFLKVIKKMDWGLE